ncbi:unnamed protein product [Meganyctiphanes norvegica]|uniref:Retrovirus-related Pol poly from transposon TNT 1-94 n=1 Tax=Meganyctiphanes norvegica TaxID=48144 RepID=A0AAV2PUQ3_MEGNR
MKARVSESAGVDRWKLTKCFNCQKLGHRAVDCTEKKKSLKRWCNKCESSTHNTNKCWRKSKNDSAKVAKVRSECSDTQRVPEKSEVEEESYDFGFMAAHVKSEKGAPAYTNSLLVDSGASAHIVNDYDKFVTWESDFNPASHSIELADGTKSAGMVKGRGNAQVRVKATDGECYEIMLFNSLYMPSYKQSILSVASAGKGEVSFNFAKETLMKMKDGTTFNIVKRGKLYYLDHEDKCDYIATAVNKDSRTVTEWHQSLGHCNMKDVMGLEKVVDGMHISDATISKDPCEACVMGKQHNQISKKPDRKATKPFQLVHTDLTGYMGNRNIEGSHSNIEGAKYVITFVSDFSGFIRVYMMKDKTGATAASAMEKFLAETNQYGEVKRLRCDNGGEYASSVFRNLLIKKGISQEFSAPDSPHQNGTAERSWRTIFDMARCLLLQSGVSKYLWPYAVKTAVYTRNRCLNRRLNMTAYEAATGVRPNISNLQVFGTVCYAYVHVKQKLDARSERGTFVGYDGESKAFLVYFPEKRKVRKARVVEFTSKFTKELAPQEPIKESIKESEPVQIFIQELVPGEPPAQKLVIKEPVEGAEGEPVEGAEGAPVDGAGEPVDSDEEPVDGAGEPVDSDEEPVDGAEESQEQQSETSAKGRYPTRERKGLLRYIELCAAYDVSDEDSEGEDTAPVVGDVPRNYKEATQSAEKEEWGGAMKGQLVSLLDNETFQVVPRPKDRKVVGSRWVYSIKSGLNDEVQYKARVVAKGFSQVADIDYHETFSPTARMTSIRMLLQLAVAESLKVHQLDFDSAYLNAEIDCEIFMEPRSFFLQQTQ